MHRSSDSVAALATALAKAQLELVNPEKSLVATLPADRQGESGQSFRYASLSSGLEIVRKTLGKHAIAVMQTTAVDQPSRIVQLTTLLAHTSGEWIASEWPVCPVTDTNAPRRMGAALTYARRYALFTLVGIAGEDDLDAPDLHVGVDRHQVSSAEAPAPSMTAAPSPAQGRGAGQGSGHNGNARTAASRSVLDSEPSAVLRDQLLAEIAALGSSDQAAASGRAILKAKNRLTVEDAKLVEAAFEGCLAEFERDEANGSNQPTQATPSLFHGVDKALDIAASGIDKSTLILGEPRRHRDKAHLKFVASHPCMVCGRNPADAHHLRFAQPRTLGRKVSDEFTVPLCRSHHRQVHRHGDEAAWWNSTGLNPIAVAESLWQETRLGAVPMAAADLHLAQIVTSAGSVDAPRRQRALAKRPNGGTPPRDSIRPES